MNIREYHAADDVVVTTVSFGETDATTPSMYLPGVEHARYSMQKYLRMEMTTETYAAALRVYSDGSNGLGTGVKIWAGTADSFTAPVIPSTTDDPPLLNGVAMVDFFSYTSGAPLSLDSTDIYTSGAIGKYLVLVAEIESTASVGLKVGENIIFTWESV
jgi:hypothetical protein